MPDLLHGQKRRVPGDCACTRQKALTRAKAPEAKGSTNKRVRKAGEVDEVRRAKDRCKSKVQHMFAVVKRSRGFTKARCRGLARNGTRAFTALAMADLYLSRHWLVGAVHHDGKKRL